MINIIKKILSISIYQYIRFNYLSKNIIRKKGAKIIPFKGTHLQIDRSAKIYLNNNLILNGNKITKSNAECLIVLRKNAKWIINGFTMLYYGAGVQVHNNAEFISGELYMNTGSLIICGYKIIVGNTVSMARMSSILDDDHHPIYNEANEIINKPKEIIIGDNVWLGMKSTVLKGANIGNQCVIGANSLITMTIPSNTMVGSSTARPIMKGIHWER